VTNEKPVVILFDEQTPTNHPAFLDHEDSRHHSGRDGRRPFIYDLALLNCHFIFKCFGLRLFSPVRLEQPWEMFLQNQENEAALTLAQLAHQLFSDQSLEF